MIDSLTVVVTIGAGAGVDGGTGAITGGCTNCGVGLGAAVTFALVSFSARG